MKDSPQTAIICVLLLVVTCTCTANRSGPYNSGGYPLAQLEEDFDQYVQFIRRDHPKTFTDPDELERVISTQRGLLRDGMTEFQFYSVVAPVGAAVRCGHTRTGLSERGREYFRENGQCLPLEIRVINDGLYVYKDFTPTESVPRGSRVLSINGLSGAVIIERLRASQYADGTNVTYKDYAINLAFSRRFTLLFGGSPQFSLEITAPGTDEPVVRTVDALSPKQADLVDKSRYAPESVCRRLCTEFSEENRYAVLTIRDFGYYGNVDAFREPVADFFARVARDGVRTLILDVRGNDGGDPYCSSFVVSHVIPEPVRYFSPTTRFYDDLIRPIPVPEHVFTGELIVLTDGWCFSSTGHMLSLLRCHHRGTFVGEESGGSTACNDASKEHELKHTGIRINVPRATFATSARCLPPGQGIPPDITVHPGIDDLIAGRDAVMEKALTLVATQ